MNEPFRDISSLCELDSTKLSNIDLYPPIPAPNGSGATKFSAVTPRKRRLRYRLSSVTNGRGNSSFCDIERTVSRLEAAVREKTRRPAQHTAAAPNFLISHTRGRHLRYLIGQ